MENIAYSFHPKTGEFLGEVECQPNPLQIGKFIVPAHATTVKPPRRREAKFRSWNGEEWVYVDIELVETPPVDEVES